MDAEALHLRQLYVAAAKKQEAFIDSKQHIGMMHAALRNLKKYIGKKKYNNRVTLVSLTWLERSLHPKEEIIATTTLHTSELLTASTNPLASYLIFKNGAKRAWFR